MIWHLLLGAEKIEKESEEVLVQEWEKPQLEDIKD
jgi:hypothetical protein